MKGLATPGGREARTSTPGGAAEAGLAQRLEAVWQTMYAEEAVCAGYGPEVWRARLEREIAETLQGLGHPEPDARAAVETEVTAAGGQALAWLEHTVFRIRARSLGLGGQDRSL